MKTSTAQRIIRGARRYGSRKVKVLVKHGGALPPELLVAYIRRWRYPVFEGAKDIGSVGVRFDPLASFADTSEIARRAVSFLDSASWEKNMNEIVTKDGVVVERGQVWRDLDKRRDNRYAKVDAVHDGIAVMYLCTAEGINSMRAIKIAVARMHKSSTGWGLVRGANGKITTVTPVVVAISPEQLANVSIEN